MVKSLGTAAPSNAKIREIARGPSPIERLTLQNQKIEDIIDCRYSLCLSAFFVMATVSYALGLFRHKIVLETARNRDGISLFQWYGGRCR